MFWKIKQKLNQIHQISQDVEQLRYSIGEMETLKVDPGTSVREFKVFSQSGEYYESAIESTYLDKILFVIPG